MNIRHLALLLIPATLTACSSQSANMRVGTDISYLSISEQREAARAVKILATKPANSESIGLVDASRCHRNTLDAAPTDEALINDLKVFAYARGGDAITDVQVNKESGLLKNCWYIITARATVLQLKN